MSSEEDSGAGGDAGADLTDEERAALQQMRNSGLSPAEVLDRAQKQVVAENLAAKLAKANVPTVTPEMVAKQAQYAAELTMTQRDMKTMLRSVIDEFPALKGDPVEYRQVEIEAAAAVRARPDYASLNTPEKMTEAFAAAAKAECERKVGKVDQAKAAVDRAKAEQRLDKQDDAVETGKGNSHSDRPTLSPTQMESFDGSICGTEANWPADETAFVNQCKREEHAFINKKLGKVKT